MIAAAAVVSLCAWRPTIAAALLLAGVAVALIRGWPAGVAIAVLALVVVARSSAAIAGLAPDTLGHYQGWATVAGDPDPSYRSTRVLLSLDGETFETWVHGRAAQLRVAGWDHGDVVWVAGERRPLDRERAGRVAWQRVVGAFEHDVLGDRIEGRRLDVAANRVRGLITRATEALGSDDHAALARGLIIGDDDEQSDAMIARFRSSGLSHLTAVSGQNVALALSITAPLLRRARPMLRLVATVTVIAWFVVLTRAEPSVLRAGTMAALSAVAFAFGGDREPVRLLAAAVVILLIVDPLLVRSVGFWLSVGATAGVTIAGPPLRRRMAALGPLATPLAMTTAAQLGVVVPSVAVFGRLAVVGLVANLAAVPVAGLVMLYGLPASLVAGAVPALRGLLMAPVAVGVAWVDAVAMLASELERRPPWNVVVTACLIAVLAAGCRRWTRARDLRDWDDDGAPAHR